MEDHKMILSIIIPYYNGASTINCCLDSIYSQGLEVCEFEVICIDDCSTDLAATAAIINYKFENYHPANLILYRHKVNKRQGGARNTGIQAAKGEWILFIDQDDFFVADALRQVRDIVKHNSEQDFIMFDYVAGNGIRQSAKGAYSALNQSIMTGAEFLQRQPVPWHPWCYIYNRSRLLYSKLQFAENVRFEDADFVLQYTAFAKQACFIPIVLVYHIIHEKEQSHVGNDKEKIGDLLKIECRITIAAERERKVDYQTGQAMMKHAIFHRRKLLKRLLWRLPYHDTKELLKKYNCTIKTGDALVDFTNRNATFTALVLSLFAPLLHILAALKCLAKRYKRYTTI